MSRTTDFTSFSPRRAAASGAGWAALRRVLGWPGRVYRARQLMHQLGRLDEHELRDIGLTRLDVAAAGALPPDADPAPFLRRRVVERRRRP